MMMIQVQPTVLLLAAVALTMTVGAQAAKKHSISCLDDDGLPVDWYIAYKFPKLKSDGAPYSTGFAYAYMTSKTTDGAAIWGAKGKKRGAGSKANWVVSDKLTTDPDSMILRTLAAAYENPELSTVMYNDAAPTQEGGLSSRAHAKGVLMVDESSDDGVWLAHSVPNFPPPKDEQLEYQQSSEKFGQTFMCISFEFAKSGEQIVNHLVNMRPLVYDSYISDSLIELVPALAYLDQDAKMPPRRKATMDSSNLAQTIETRAGQPIQLYSKSGQIKEDIYAAWLDNELKSSLYVLTWRRGSGNLLGSTCPPKGYRVNNVEEVKIDTGDTDVWWTSTNDHSKWAISDDADLATVCLSDVNRAESQFSRGGGTICMHCPTCWQIFSNSIRQVEPCPIRGHQAR